MQLYMLANTDTKKMSNALHKCFYFTTLTLNTCSINSEKRINISFALFTCASIQVHSLL